MKFAPDGYVFMFGTFAVTLLLALWCRWTLS